MRLSLLKQNVTGLIPEILAVLLVLQPILEIVSYFGAAAPVLVIRAVLLVLVSVLGFAAADNKAPFFILYAVLIGFGLLHILGCVLGGYQNPAADLAAYLRLCQLPLWTFSFIAFFHAHPGLNEAMSGVLATNFLLVGVSALLAGITKSGAAADAATGLGRLGWFGSGTVQTAVLAALSVAVLLWALEKENLFLFSAVLLAVLSLLYSSGMPAAFVLSLFCCLAAALTILARRWHPAYLLPVLAAVILLFVFRGASPAARIETAHREQVSAYQLKTQEALGSDPALLPGDLSAGQKARVEEIYQEVYSSDEHFAALLQRFGPAKTAEAYQYSLDAEKLLDVDKSQSVYHRLLRTENGFFARLVGAEYEPAAGQTAGSGIGGVVTGCGYLGTALVLVFLLYFVWIALRHIADSGLSRAFSSAFPLALFMTGALLITVFQSGDVLLRPGASVYLSLGAALLYSHAFFSDSRAYTVSKYVHKSSVTIKRV